jgi:hypothetical protein
VETRESEYSRQSEKGDEEEEEEEEEREREPGIEPKTPLLNMALSYQEYGRVGK